MVLFRVGVAVFVVGFSACVHVVETKPPVAKPAPATGDLEDGDAQFNEGLKLQLEDKPALALPHFEAAVRVDPDDWHSVSKLIQVHQALGNLVERDRWRATLMSMYRAGKIINPTMPVFCREQFALGDRWVVVLESFELKSPKGVRYSFNVQSKKTDGETLLEITLASSDWDNAFAESQGKTTPSDRVFFLDEFAHGSQMLLGGYHGEPTYDEVRQAVVQRLAPPAKP
jgi:hypothetical protein